MSKDKYNRSNPHDFRLKVKEIKCWDDLPQLFQDVLNPFEGQDKKVILMGLLGITSSILTNVSGVYAGRLHFPNMYIYILGPASSGKGIIDNCRIILEDITKEYRHSNTIAWKKYGQEESKYQRCLKKYNQNKSEKVPIRPEKPKDKHLIAPGNVSAAYLLDDLSANKDGVLMFESEGDTIANTFRQDYGNYSDMLRKAFHHETISKGRSEAETKYKEVNNPRLSAVLSSTWGQLLSLMRTPENGLVSRFSYMETEGLGLE